MIGAAANQTTPRRGTVPAGRSLHPGRPAVRQVWALGTVGIPLAGTVLAKVAVLAMPTFAAARLGTGRTAPPCTASGSRWSACSSRSPW
jgi:MATE family multidrug resistance protein